jgi:hypothetical protein
MRRWIMEMIANDVIWAGVLVWLHLRVGVTVKTILRCMYRRSPNYVRLLLSVSLYAVEDNSFRIGLSYVLANNVGRYCLVRRIYLSKAHADEGHNDCE